VRRCAVATSCAIMLLHVQFKGPCNSRILEATRDEGAAQPPNAIGMHRLARMLCSSSTAARAPTMTPRIALPVVLLLLTKETFFASHFC
jgi:hypothetical protein